MKPLVLIVMGSASDKNVMEEAAKMLTDFAIPYKMTLASAHRSPDRARRILRLAEEDGVQVVIAGAGGAAHLAGTLAAETILPIIGVPIGSSALNGMDALLSTVQMPGGVPVATMAIGPAGAKNAAIFAAQILARTLTAEQATSLANRLLAYKKSLADALEACSEQM